MIMKSTSLGRAFGVGIFLFWTSRTVWQLLFFNMKKRIHQILFMIFLFGVLVHGVAWYMDNTEERWPDDTPKEQLERLNKATNKSNRQKALAEWLSRGYSKVRFCGKHSVSDRVTVVPTGRELTAHWRRGH